MRYTPSLIEPKWQKRWDDEKTFQVPQDLNLLKNKPKYYVLDMFPYPSGSGLHVGHPEGYTATDVMARMKRMQGYAVLHPMGWDAFGLPAERAAQRENIHPAIITKQNIDNFRRQIKALGFSYDWSRELSTTDVEYYKWTQWIFLKLYEKGLAYLAEVPVNWCPALQTVLANEEVKDGKYVETGDVVEKRRMKQWMLKITAYADRLLEDLDELDWPEGIKEMQRNWIGKSTGAHIRFAVQGHAQTLEVFTTRPDTLFGVTYCVLSPEHPLVFEIAKPEYQEALKAYLLKASEKADSERQDINKPKTGVFTGAYAIHPLTGDKLPIWVADYVLVGYGTGAIMAVPSQDERDQAFANVYNLPVKHIENADTEALLKELERLGAGEKKIQYRLRDWLFSRQRYWGEPFPVVHIQKSGEETEVVPLCLEDVPVELPMVDQYQPTADGRPPLARASEAWLKVTLPDGRVGERETNTMPQWAGSCWYYLRFMDPCNTKEPFSKAWADYWLPVDLYIGGVEHAVLHLLYARFWHKVLYDCGLVSTKEPFYKLFNQGMILGQSFQDEAGKYYYKSDVEEKNGQFYTKDTHKKLKSQIEKMSKSRYNVVNPDDIISEYGADTMRIYELFMGPLEQVKPWQDAGLEGVYRFLSRVWRLVIDENTGALSDKIIPEPERDINKLRLMHQSIKKVTQDTLDLKFNTAISQMMIWVNDLTASPQVSKEALISLLQILSPYAPHLCEELYEKLGFKTQLAYASWPSYNEDLCKEDRITIVIQINGKRKEEIQVDAQIEDESLKKQVLGLPSIKKYLNEQVPKKIILVKGRLVNIVL